MRIAASLTIAEHLLPRWLTALRSAWPNMGIELRVENSERVAELIGSGQADLGFIEGPGPPAGLEVEVLGTDELLVVCAPSHPWATVTAISPTELAATRLVVREQGAGGRHLLTLRLADVGLRLVAPAAEIASPGALAAAVAAGVAPGVVSGWAVSSDLATGRLRRVDVPGLDLRRDLRALWRPGYRPLVVDRLLGLIGPTWPTPPYLSDEVDDEAG